MDQALVREHDIFAAMRKSPISSRTKTDQHGLYLNGASVIQHLQKAPRVERVVSGEESVRDFRGILQGLAVGEAIAAAVHFLVERQNRIIEAGIGAIPEILLTLDAAELVHFARRVAAIVRHQIGNAAALFERHLTATLGHAVEEGVPLERGQFLVLWPVAVPHLWRKGLDILRGVGRLCKGILIIIVGRGIRPTKKFYFLTWRNTEESLQPRINHLGL